MNRYNFENLISDYLEGELSFSKRKEFEFYMEENEDARLLFLKVKNTLNNMKNTEKISTPDDFNSKLLSKIKDKTPLPLMPNDRGNIFGLSPLHASIFSSLCLAVIFISYSLIAPKPVSNSNLEYSLVPIDKSHQAVQSQIVKNNTSFTANDKSDSLDVNTKKYQQNKNNKIKFVNY
jgi:anti-sigma-K factor RskA